MNTQLFIKRPISTTLIMVAILLFGIFAYRLLPVSDLPNVDFPTIQVTTQLPGANPEDSALPCWSVTFARWAWAIS